MPYTPDARSASDPVAQYLAAVDQCRKAGVGSSDCAKAAALQAAAYAAGIDPQIAHAAQTCVETGDLGACGKAAAAAAATAACVGLTGGAAAPICGPVATAVVNFVWPVISSVVGSIADGAMALVNFGLEAIGLKSAPEFGDVAIRMSQAAVATFQSAIRDASKAIADAIIETRRRYGYNDMSIFVRDRIRTERGPVDSEYRWADTGRYMWLTAAAEEFIWDRMANDSRFSAGLSSSGGYGSVGLQPGSMGADRAKNIESAYTLVSLVPWWDISWDYAWERDNAFDFGARSLAQFYAKRMEALRDAIMSASLRMTELESMNPASIKAMNQAAQRPELAAKVGGETTKKGGVGGALLAVGILAGLGGIGYYAWRKYGK